MSGTEAIAVVGIIANIIALAKFSCNVVSQIKELGENVHGVPKAFRDIETLLPLISSTLARTRDQIESGSLDDHTCMVLRPVLEGCEKKLKQLRVLFDSFLAQGRASKLKRGLIAITRVCKYDEVKEIALALDRFVMHLTHYHASQGVTSKDIESLRTATTSMSVKQSEAKFPKPYFLVPVQWSDGFAGREEIMAYLESKLCLQGQYSRVAIVGLGGMGKTRIALEYANNFRNFKQISVFWVYAGTLERFRSAYHGIAQRLNIPGHQDPGSDILNQVKERLQDDRSGQWLMILDNADDADLIYGSGSLRLATYIPRSDQGSILLTTRFRKIGASFTSMRNVVSLQSMTLMESEMLLRARLNDESSGQNHDLYQELAEELEGTPLALVQAASFMSQNCISLDTYLRMYHESDVSKIRLLSEGFEDDIRDAESKNPIATTWIISFDYIRLFSPQAADFLSLMSVVDAQNIPQYLISQGEDSISFNKAIGILEAFSFISSKKASPGSLHQYDLIDVHRLVRLAVRNWFKKNNALDQKIAEMVKIIALSYSKIESDKFEKSFLILPHTIELFKSDLLQCGNESSQTLRPEESKKPSLTDLLSVSTATSTKFLESIHLLEKVDTVTHLMEFTAELVENVTSSLRHVGNYVEAGKFAAKGVFINTRVFGPSHSRTLLSMREYATMLQYTGEYEHAGQLRRQMVTICEAEYGFLHILTLENLLSFILFLSGEDLEQEARETAEITVQRCRESLSLHEGKEHLAILTILAETQQYSENLEEAERCALLALNGHRAARNDLEVINALDLLSRIYEKQDNLDLAGDTKRTALDVYNEYYGPAHPSTINLRWDLVTVLLDIKQIDEARLQVSLALKLLIEVYGTSSDIYTHFYREFADAFSLRGYVLSSEEHCDTIRAPSSNPDTDIAIVIPSNSHGP